MAETKQIATNTEVTVTGTSLVIYTFYDQAAGEALLNFFITELISIINNINFVEGELGYNIAEMPNTSFLVDDNGELIAIDIDASVYSIDGLGYAILNSVLGIPVLTSALLSAEGELVVAWTGVTGATGYRYDISLDPQFISYYSGYINTDIGDQVTLTLTVDPTLLYYIRVRAYDGIECSFNSNILTAQVTSIEAPLILAATPISDEEMNLAWTNEATYSNIYIEFSEDGMEFTEFAVVNGSLETYLATGLTGSREYFWRIRGRSGSVYSEYSETVNAWTAWKILVSAVGAGTDATTFAPNGSGTMTMTIDGTGKFYTNRAGTTGENTSVTWNNNTLQYIRVPSGTSNLLIFHQNQLTNIGNAYITGSAGLGMYAYSGNSPHMSFSVASLPKSISEIAIQIGTGGAGFTGDLSDLSAGFLKLYLSGTGLITGSFADLPSTMLVYNVFMPSTVIVNLWDIPTSMVYLNLLNGCIVTGSTADIPSGALKYFYGYATSNLITGTIAGLAHVGCVLEVFWCGYTFISGNIADIPASIKIFSISGNDTITGDLADLKEGLVQIEIITNNTITGDIADLPASIQTITIRGNNTIDGNLNGLQEGLINVFISGLNTIAGDIVNIPSTVTNLYIYGYNTITGDLVSLQSTLVNFAIGGVNTIYGSLSSLPNGIKSMILQGQNIVNAYTGGKTWSSSMYGSFIFTPVSPGGLSSAQIDSLIIDLNNALSIMNQPITLIGTNAPRTATSDAAVAALLAKGCVVTTN
jgi:hypothetical protein